MRSDNTGVECLAMGKDSLYRKTHLKKSVIPTLSLVLDRLRRLFIAVLTAYGMASGINTSMTDVACNHCENEIIHEGFRSHMEFG